MTKALFRDNAYAQQCTAIVMDVQPDGIVLDQTVFYPRGGGQPGDSGILLRENGEKIRLTDTRTDSAGNILHIPEQPIANLESGQSVSAKIDWKRRYGHMRMHTGLHLLGAVLRYPVTGGAITAEKSRLDFDMEDTVDKESVTAALNDLIRADHPIRTRWITDAELEAQPELIRTMSVKPPTGAGRVRLLEIPGVDLQPCGGTHVTHTAEIGPMRVSKVEKKGRHNRRLYVVFAESDRGDENSAT